MLPRKPPYAGRDTWLSNPYPDSYSTGLSLAHSIARDSPLQKVRIMKIIPKPKESPSPQGQIVYSPAVRIDSAMRILYANPAAQMAGLRAGDTLHLAYGAGESLRHEAAWNESPLTRYAPLDTPQNAALYELENSCGFRFAYVEYTYTFHRCHAIAVLFRTRREYIAFAATLERGPHRYILALRRALSALREECRQAFTVYTNTSLSADTVEEILSLTLLSLQCFYPDTLYTGGKRLYSLTRLVEEYLIALQRYSTALADQLNITATAQKAELYTPLDPECLYLILSALLSAVSDLSDDHTAAVSLNEAGDDRSIYIRTSCRRLCGLLCHTTDLLSLAVGAPRKEMHLSMAEHLCSYCGYEIHIFGEEDSGQLTIQIYMPAHPAETDFKAPLVTDTHLEGTLRAICRLFTLMDADQKKENYNYIHGSLMLCAEQQE